MRKPYNHWLALKMDGICRLCGNEGRLEESHIVPKFVYRWLRKSSASGYLRFTANPNKRVQDGTKYYLLCSECEDRLEKWETRFSKSVFYPYLQDFWFHGSYGDWLIKFSVSITWRALSYIRETQGIEYFSEDLGAHADSADQTWREFMLGEAPHPGKFEQHLVLLDAIESHTTPGLPATMNRYLLRATDIDAVTSRKQAFVYCKLPKMAFFGFIHMERPREWEGTKLHVKHGKFGQQDIVIPHSVYNYMKERAEKISGALSEISDRQNVLIEEAMMKDIKKTANSASFEAMQHDVRLSGKRAFTKNKS